MFKTHIVEIWKTELTPPRRRADQNDELELKQKLLAPSCAIVAGKNSIQICRGTDQRQMSECLGKIPKVAPVWAKLFGVESKMVSISQEFLKQQLRLLDFASSCQAFDVPKRARSEAAFSTWKPVDVRAFRLIAMDEDVLN